MNVSFRADIRYTTSTPALSLGTVRPDLIDQQQKLSNKSLPLQDAYRRTSEFDSCVRNKSIINTKKLKIIGRNKEKCWISM